MILRQRLPTIHEDKVFEKIPVAGQYRIIRGLKKGGSRRPASAKNRRTIQSSSRPNIEDFYRKSAELTDKSNAVGLGTDKWTYTIFGWVKRLFDLIAFILFFKFIFQIHVIWCTARFFDFMYMYNLTSLTSEVCFRKLFI